MRKKSGSKRKRQEGKRNKRNKAGGPIRLGFGMCEWYVGVERRG
jgi:hypothetical protein